MAAKLLALMSITDDNENVSNHAVESQFRLPGAYRVHRDGYVFVGWSNSPIAAEAKGQDSVEAATELERANGVKTLEELNDMLSGADALFRHFVMKAARRGHDDEINVRIFCDVFDRTDRFCFGDPIALYRQGKCG